MSNLDEIRKKLKALENKNSGNFNAEKGDSDMFAHWNMPDNGGTSLVRFLPDKDPDNVFFWVERQQIKLPFPGVAGEDEHKEVIVTVPCADMWGKNLCPITRETQPWWNDESLKNLASKYWKKRSYLMQGFVIEDGVDGKTPPNVIKRFVFNSSLFKIIKSTLLDPDMMNSPVHFDMGTNFRINKTKQGKWADYSTSVWARRETSLTEEQRHAIQTQGLHNLSDFLPKKPTDEELKIIYEMFEASVNGELYDPKKWGAHFKPYGMKEESGAQSRNNAPAAELAPAPSVNTAADNSPPFDMDPQPIAKAEVANTVSAPAQSAADILAALRARKSK